MQIKYVGKDLNMFICEMCGERSKEKYIATPEIKNLVNWDKITVCKKCARREIGSRNAKKWDRIHEG